MFKAPSLTIFCIMPAGCLPLILIALVACTPVVSEPAGPCTENFSLPAGAKITHTQTGPDFNVHDVLWKNEKFGIYEGNYPQQGDQGSRVAVKLPVDRKARIGIAEGRGSIIVATGKDWPAYLDVMGPCRSDKNCAVVKFGAGLRGL